MILFQLTIGPENSFENYLEARRFFHNKSMSRRGKPVDRHELVYNLSSPLSILARESLSIGDVHMQKGKEEKNLQPS